MGMFGGSLFNPNQRYGDGFDPVTGAMSLSGGPSAAQQVSRGGDGVDPSTMHPSFFQQGGTGRNIAGYVGDALLRLSGGQPIYAPMKMEEAQQQAEFARQAALARFKQQNPDPTGTMQNVQAAGFQPGTPEYQQFMQKAILAPKVVGVPNAAGGTDYVDMNAPAPAIPTVSDEATYNAIPKGAQYRDPSGNVRVKQ